MKAKLVHEFIQCTGIVRDSVFIDLGSGVGNAVLQVATETGCEAWGIEIMDIPAEMAIVNLREWKARMRLVFIGAAFVKSNFGTYICPPCLDTTIYRMVRSSS